jgi:hypothetical protein
MTSTQSRFGIEFIGVLDLSSVWERGATLPTHRHKFVGVIGALYMAGIIECIK